jgi:hypothetical protein
MPALTVHNAEIKTATVEIRTLTISGKQVTLAVFRQLKEAQLVNEDGSLAGVPWGTVNYHPDKCAADDRHLHVVWQHAEELRRSKVDEPNWYRDWFWPESGLSDELIQVEYCANDHGWPKWARGRRLPGDSFDSPIFTVDGFSVSANLPDSPSSTWKAVYRRDHECGDLTKEAREALFEELRGEVAEEKARRARMDARWRELGDLPQLFIAV